MYLSTSDPTVILSSFKTQLFKIYLGEVCIQSNVCFPRIFFLVFTIGIWSPLLLMISPPFSVSQTLKIVFQVWETLSLLTNSNAALKLPFLSFPLKKGFELWYRNRPRVSYGMSTKLKNLKGPIPTGSSPSDRVIYTSKDAHWNVEYDVNCFQIFFLNSIKATG